MSQLDEIVEGLGRFSLDPLGFVLWNYPWGEPGSELEGQDGPDEWQRDFLDRLGTELCAGRSVVQMAAATGNGVGKTALLAWLADWSISTMEDTKGVITAQTEAQLRTRVWAEIAKWQRMGLSQHLFDLSATSLCSRDPKHDRTWRLDIQPWSSGNPVAFQGYHNYGKRLFMAMDEGSEISDAIWEAIDGSMTDRNTQIIRIVFANPTKSDGRFRECFAPGGRFAEDWLQFHVDSRTSRRTNPAVIDRMIAAWGIDSDYVRIRVLGQFPEGAVDSFIPYMLALEATTREPLLDREAPVVLGVDVGRGGTDPSVIFPRQGFDAFSRRPRMLSTGNTMELVAAVVATFNEYEASMIFIDAGGVGGGVADRLLEMGYPVIPVDFGSKPDNAWASIRGIAFYNKRAEIYGALREWLYRGRIPELVPGCDMSLPRELSLFLYEERKGMLLLESKDDMRARAKAESPNLADALACTFALPHFREPARLRGLPASVREADPLSYDPFSSSSIYSEVHR